jgi:integrase
VGCPPLRQESRYEMTNRISDRNVTKVPIDKVSPHGLRRTCARLFHSAGGELEQIQFLLGHRSVETTERYLGSRQRIVHAVNDKLGIEPYAGPG